jgi:sugar phosphate isomerase/epimerase
MTHDTATTGTRGLRFGYGTNGFANHRLDDALTVIAELGYAGVALTLDHDHLDPYAEDLTGRTAAVAARLQELGLGVVVETGARYLLDPRRKHEPTFVSDQGRERRIDFLLRAVQVGADLGAEAVSFWSGILPGAVSREEGWERLLPGVARVVDAAERLGVQLGFEPEPGMFIETLDEVVDLRARLGDPSALGVTVDVGHCRCNEPRPAPECIRRVGDLIVNVQIDDMVRGVHEHLEFGEGEVDFPPVLAALREVGYRGLDAVELPRHAHAAPAVAERSLRFLRAAEQDSLDRSTDSSHQPGVRPASPEVTR